MEEVNEDCGCGGTTNNIRSFNSNNTPKYSQDPLVGRRVSLRDGRSGLVDDSIRNNTGEVIGYVIEGDKGNYRVFKDKIIGTMEESGGAMASLEGTPGMGDVIPPGPGRTGSGDQFPSLTVGTPAARKKKKNSNKNLSENPIDTSVMDYKSFISNSRKNQ